MDVGSLIARGRGLLESGQHAEAARCLESAVRRAPQFPDLHNLLGLALSLSGEPLRAESHLQRALELNPDYAEARINLAILLFERNAYSAAREHLREFNRIARGNPSTFPEPALDHLARRHAELAERYRAYGLLEEAEREMRAALGLRPGYGDLRLRLVRLLFERGKLEEAAAQLERLLQQRPGYQDAQLLRGQIELARGNAAAARDAWLQVRSGAAATQARALLEGLENGHRAARWGGPPAIDATGGGRP